MREQNYEKKLKRWFRRCVMWHRLGGVELPLDLENPKTLNQKIQWSKLYDSTLLKSHLTDKYLAKIWVKDMIGEEHIIKTLGVYDKFDDINFDELPDRFVIKSTHGSGQVVVVQNKDNLDMKKLRTKINHWLSEDYAFHAGYELHYSNIIPRIIIEEYVEGMNGELEDYKILCINGEPQFLWVDTGRFSQHRRCVYDLNWNLLPISINYKQGIPTNKPPQLGKMLEIAKKLSNGFAFVRVDLYILKNGDIKFGEMTFTSRSGIGKYPREISLELGAKIVLPQKTEFKKLTKTQLLEEEKKFIKEHSNT